MAIEKSLAEDPDLAILEDDALDLYSQQTMTQSTAATYRNSWARKEGDGRGTAFGAGSSSRGGRKKQRSPVGAQPLRAIHYSRSPVPCFMGEGIVLRPADVAVSRNSSSSSPPGAVDVLGRCSPVGVREKTDRECSCVACGEGRNGGRSLLVVGCGGWEHGEDEKNQGQGFQALIEAFARRGRPERGIEKLIQRIRTTAGGGEGEGQQLAALDDIHASLLVGKPGEVSVAEGGRYSSITSDDNEGCWRGGRGRGSSVEVVGSDCCHAVNEIGIRTSMSKGNRWVIGRRVEEERGNGTKETVDKSQADDGGVAGSGELYAIVDAPILSIGDARAAAERMFSRVGNGHVT